MTPFVLAQILDDIEAYLRQQGSIVDGAELGDWPLPFAPAPEIQALLERYGNGSPELLPGWWLLRPCEAVEEYQRRRASDRWSSLWFPLLRGDDGDCISVDHRDETFEVVIVGAEGEPVRERVSIAEWLAGLAALYGVGDPSALVS